MMQPMDGTFQLVAGPDDAGRRLDKVLRSRLKDKALSEIYAALRKGRIRVGGAKASPDLRLAEGDRISLPSSLIGVPQARAEPLAELEPGSATSYADAGVGDDLKSISDILILATKDLIFVNKPRGELSQDSRLEERLRLALARRSCASLSFSPGPLHRLDRNTTGILCFPRSAEGARVFSSLIRERRLRKSYLALVDGEERESAEWIDRIERDERSLRSYISDSGKPASASMRPLVSGKGHSLVLVELHTGLTHQIRVQASSREMPLSGDLKYGGSPFEGGYILHAFSLSFPESPFPDLPRLVSAPLPPSAYRRLAAILGETRLERALSSSLEAR
jgi:23S rRNA pseudouridine955/2504/2580 synthase